MIDHIGADCALCTHPRKESDSPKRSSVVGGSIVLAAHREFQLRAKSIQIGHTNNTMPNTPSMA